jgi:biopolymer transport protein ExbD
MIERQLGSFSLAFLGVAVVLFIFMFSVTPIVCGFGPSSFVLTPFARTASIIRESERDLAIFVRPDRQIFVSSVMIPLPSLASELSRLAAIAPDRHVLITADGTVPFGVVQQVLRASREAGFRNLTLVTFRGNRLQAFRLGAAV